MVVHPLYSRCHDHVQVVRDLLQAAPWIQVVDYYREQYKLDSNGSLRVVERL